MINAATAPTTNNLEVFRSRYRQYMEVLNRSSRTIQEYNRIIDHFINFLMQIGVSDIYEITKEQILSYQKEVFYQLNYKGQQTLPQTHNNYLKTVKSFFKFLQIEGYLVHNPAKDIPYARQPQQLPRTILTQDEIEKLLNQPDTGTPLGYRDRAILEVLYSTGIRRQELMNLEPADVDYEKGFLRVNRGKGGKDRIVPLGRIACKYVENYIKLVRIDMVRKQNSPHLFLSLIGNQISRSALRELILGYARKAKINKAVTPHVFRHTCATHLIRRNANIRCVQEILGHQSLDTTQKYTQITITDLKEAHQACHPREKEEKI